jgi:hypothetical protein
MADRVPSAPDVNERVTVSGAPAGDALNGLRTEVGHAVEELGAAG